MTADLVATLHSWHVPRRAMPGALLRMAVGPRALRGTPGLLFAKLLGTGSGRTFTVGDADPLRWALLSVWEDDGAAEAFDRGPALRRWRAAADEEWSVRLRPLVARGLWSGREPFGRPQPQRWDGPVAAVTRARLAPRRALAFWRSVPPVSADLHDGPGLRFALGIGEAPVGLQGTFSVWESAAALNDFAYARPAHLAVVRRTAELGWYAEELFARFAVLGATGTVDGADPLAGLLPGHPDAPAPPSAPWEDGAPGVVRLPSGRLVRGQGLRRDPGGPAPTFAVHLLGRRPAQVPWESRWVRWPDFRLPTDRAQLRRVLLEALDAAGTQRVELACGGGRGRTGTALACLAVLDGVAPGEAVAWVREHYDRRAVETRAQARFVAAFR